MLNVDATGASSASGIALEALHITKTYPGVVALSNASLCVKRGSVHALVGGNGAGKSTLMKVIRGITVPDGGTMRIGDVEVQAMTPRGARALGVSMVPQEREIAFDLSVTENVLLGRMPRNSLGLIDWRQAKREVQDRLQRLGLNVDVNRNVRDLSVSDLQAIEIARALHDSTKLVLMDEPTSALGGADIEKLFAAIRSLARHGIAVVYISHHLEEIFAVADEVTVLRDGRVVATEAISGLTTERLVSLMVGQEYAKQVVAGSSASPEAEPGAPLLEARDVVFAPTLKGVSLTLRSGEILCVTGALGSGRTELARCLAGVSIPTAGSVRAFGRPLRSPRDAVRSGVVLLPADRKKQALLLELSVLDNIVVGEINATRKFFVNPRRQRREALSLVERLAVKTPSLSKEIRLLSGGNQQKALVSRWLQTRAKVFIFDEPTAGIDIHTKFEIYALLRDLAAAGAAIAVFSSDFEEIGLLAHRCVVLSRGKVLGELTGDDINDENLLQLSAGCEPIDAERPLARVCETPQTRESTQEVHS